ncbi:MAG: hypothetical protein JWL72_3580 [Ilumatobacteraceae bacterium]|nr:hypothetical protein [Ilumatobacteraceae bacterium]
MSSFPPPPPAGSSPGEPGSPLPFGVAAPVARKSKKGLFIGLGVVAVVAIAVIVVVSRGSSSGDDADRAPLSAAAAYDGLAAVLAGIEFDDSGYGEHGGLCPFGDTDPLVDELPASIERTSDFLADRGGENHAVKNNGYSAVICTGEPDDPESIVKGLQSVRFVALIDPPEDIASFVKDTNDPSVDLVLDADRPYAGGRIVGYCQTSEDGQQHGCSAAWVQRDDGVAILLQLLDRDVKSKQAVDALKVLLPDMLDGLAANKD